MLRIMRDKSLAVLCCILAGLITSQAFGSDPLQDGSLEPPGNSLLRFFDVGPEYATAGVAGLATSSDGSVYMVGGVGELPPSQGILRKFDSNGRLLWTIRPDGTNVHFRQVVVDDDDQLYVISEYAAAPVKPRIHKFTKDGDLLWITEIDPPFDMPEFEFLGGQALRVVAQETGVLVGIYFTGYRQTDQGTRLFQVGSALSLSNEGVVAWRTNFWPTVDWSESWPAAENDVWVWSEYGARVRSLIPDGSGGAYVIGDRRLVFGNDGFYFHLSDQGRPIQGAVSLREQLQRSGLIDESLFRDLGFEPVWIVEGNSGVLYISGAWNPVRNSAALIAITPEGVPIWLSGQPCSEEDVWAWRCGIQQYLHPKVLTDGTLLVLEQVQKTDNGNQINLIHFSMGGEVLSTRIIADTEYGLGMQVRGLVVDKKMLWMSGAYSTLGFFDDFPPVRAIEHGSFLLRCPLAVFKSGGSCPIRPDDGIR